jgi:hypothetical protein
MLLQEYLQSDKYAIHQQHVGLTLVDGNDDESNLCGVVTIKNKNSK